MPLITMAFEPEEGKKIYYKKYLDPSEFNVFVQNKFVDWHTHSVEYFKKFITEDLSAPTG